ncbi:hypothetical protein AVEN_20441-1, partial [Araneus ventricosus]
QAPYTAYLQWNRVSNLEPFGSKAVALPVCYNTTLQVQFSWDPQITLSALSFRLLEIRHVFVKKYVLLSWPIPD